MNVRVAEDTYSFFITDKLSSLKDDWEKLFDVSVHSYCQSYCFMHAVHSFTQKTIIQRIFFHKIRYYCVKRNNETILILPLYTAKKHAYFAGYNASVNYMGCVHSAHLKKDDIVFLFESLKKSGIRFLDTGLLLHTNIPLYAVFDDLKNEYLIQEKNTINVELRNLFKTFDGYFKSLSKSTRQNYRTAINRLAKDGKIYAVKIYGATDVVSTIPDTAVNAFMQMHKNRLRGRYENKERSWLISLMLQPFRKLVYGKYLKDSISYYSMTYGNRQILAELNIDGKPAAYYYGLLTNKRLNFMRVCVDDEHFGKYSPGMVLGIELVRQYIADISVFDFTCGNEKYKYKLGCQDTLNKSFSIDLMSYKFDTKKYRGGVFRV